MEMKYEQTMWVLLFPSKELDGVWVGHCLDVDVVTQGAGFHGALTAVLEAVGVALTDDVAHGLDPAGRPRAPQEDWDQLQKVLTHANRVPLSSVPENERDKLAMVVTQMSIVIDAHRVDVPREEFLPEPWMIAARQSAGLSAPCY